MATKKLKHPDAKGTVEAREEDLEMYLSQGWSVVEPPAKSDK
jgi:hypothetical protein